MKKDLTAIIESLNTPHADKIYIAKDYTKADLRADLIEIRDNFLLAISKAIEESGN